MKIDYGKVRDILEANPPVNDCATYYRQYEVPQEWLGPLVPDFGDLLRRTFRPAMHVLDVGCGRGETLLAHARMFRQGTGVDESEEVMIAAANRARPSGTLRTSTFELPRRFAFPWQTKALTLSSLNAGPSATWTPRCRKRSVSLVRAA